MGVTAIIAAGGKGMRMGADKNKVFLELAGKEILVRTIDVFENNSLISDIVIVTGKEDIEECNKLIKKHGYNKINAVTAGGNTRRESVCRGLKYAKQEIIAVHDAARALVTDEIIRSVVTAAERYGAAAPGVLCNDTLKKADSDGFIEATVDRSTVYQIQTPQVFKRDIILEAHESAGDFEATDDCVLAEKMGVKIKITAGSYENIKLTTPEDMIIGENILKRRGVL